MLRRAIGILISLWTMLGFAPSQAAPLNLPSGGLRRLGLTEAWMTSVQAGSRQARVEHLFLHVSPQRTFKVVDVRSAQGERHFSENDLGPGGQAIGSDEAIRLAEKEVIRLRALGQEPQTAEREIPITTLYVQTSQGTLQSLNAENGQSNWAITVGDPRHPSLPPAANDRFVAVVNGSDLYVVDRATGEPIWQQRLAGIPSAGPAVSETMVYVPMLSGQIEGYWLDDSNRPPWIYQSGGRIATPPVVSPYTLSWTTERGFLYVSKPEESGVQFRMPTGGPMENQAGLAAPGTLLAASTDGYLYSINENNGNLLWQFSAGMPIRQTPVAIEEGVYVITDQGPMYCISAADGQERWLADHVKWFLAATSDRVYCMTRRGVIRVLNRQTGGLVGSIAAAAFDLQFANSLTDRIYLATHDGALICLREASMPWPLVHRTSPFPASTEEATNVEPSSPSDAASSVPAAAPAAVPVDAPPADEQGGDLFDDIGDPFGEDAFDDPLGGDPLGDGGLGDMLNF